MIEATNREQLELQVRRMTRRDRKRLQVQAGMRTAQPHHGSHPWIGGISATIQAMRKLAFQKLKSRVVAK